MIHTIQLRLSNAFLVIGDRPILVDSGSPGECEVIEQTMRKTGVDPGDIALVFLTHVHGDHAGSAAEFARRFDCPVAFHAGDQPIMDRGSNGKLVGIGLRGKMLEPFFLDGEFEQADRDVELVEGQRLDEFGIAGKVIGTPGHTAGSVTLLLDNGDAIVGDALMGGYLGGKLFSSRPMLPYFCEDIDQVHDSIQNIIESVTGQIYVGHGGPLTSKAVERRFA
ncbi:MAG: MBL fold metallo-hydrolase, partial [Planctomycetota bacterium]